LTQKSIAIVRWLPAALTLAAVVDGSAAAAQTSSRPGPWALDLRAVSSPVPEDPAFYPRLHTSAEIPTRGLGLEIGGHVYLLNLGASRLGVGASVFSVRSVTRPVAPTSSSGSGGGGATTATAVQDLQIDLRTIAPQISFNFGTRDGWSYLSAGAGRTDVVTKTAGAIVGRRQSERTNALNVGGGARWFLKSHLGVGFDIRLHMVSAGTAGPIEETPPPGTIPPTTPPSTSPVTPTATPGKTMLTISGGFSFK
jgi:hypothetical protein